MLFQLYDMTVQIIGNVPPILTPIYWFGTLFLFLIICKILYTIFNWTFSLLGNGRRY